MISFIHLQLRINSGLCITLPVLTSRVRNKARYFSPQASVSWGWSTCVRTDMEIKAAAASNQRWGSFIKSLPVENLSPTSHRVSLPGARPPVFHSLPFCERLLSFFTLLFLTLALSAFAVLLIKIANWMDVYNKCLKFFWKSKVRKPSVERVS